MRERPGVNQFSVFLDSLEEQVFKEEIEVIIVDALKDVKIENSKLPAYLTERKEYNFSKYSFPVKHIKPLPSWWLEHGFSSYCHCVNSGIIAADGELIILFDDCSKIMGRENIKLQWEWYKKGDGKQFARSIYEYWIGDKPRLNSVEGKPSFGKIVRHMSYDRLEEKNKLYIEEESFGSYGYYSFSLDVILALNGYNELFDGAKGAEDFDIGNRLMAYGCRSIVDMRLRVVEFSHYSTAFHGLNVGVGRKNNVSTHEALLHLWEPDWKDRVREKKTFIKANDRPMTEQEYNYMLERNKVYVPNFVEDEVIKRMKTHPPIFDLKDLRKKYREGFYNEK